jgi:hypothetical protein
MNWHMFSVQHSVLSTTDMRTPESMCRDCVLRVLVPEVLAVLLTVGPGPKILRKLAMEFSPPPSLTCETPFSGLFFPSGPLDQPTRSDPRDLKPRRPMTRTWLGRTSIVYPA